MADNKITFKLDGKVLSIDFSKLESGMKNDDKKINESIFNEFAGEDGVLDALEIQNIKARASWKKYNVFSSV